MFIRKRYAWVAAIATTAGIAGCGGDEETNTDTTRAETEPEATQTATPEKAAWSYEGDTGPERWGDLSVDFAKCEAGREQSPVNLTRATEADLADIEFAYEPADYEVVNNGHTIQANTENGGGIQLDGERYELVQFHAHTPSEHTVDGTPSELEVHLVHQNDAGELAVVGVLAEEGAGGGALADAWAEVPEEEGATTTLNSFDAERLLPDERESYRYEGSLTTPPCTEEVRWIVMADQTTVAPSVASEFDEVVGPNARPVQPLNQREVELDANGG